MLIKILFNMETNHRYSQLKCQVSINRNIDSPFDRYDNKLILLQAHQIYFMKKKCSSGSFEPSHLNNCGNMLPRSITENLIIQAHTNERKWWVQGF